MKPVHPLSQYAALLPRYVTRFSCIGPRCEDNCCTGWRVSVDQSTCRAWQMSGDALPAERLARTVEFQAERGGKEYALIRMNPQTRECSFLEDGLCAIHRELGAAFLPNICFGYPRVTRSISGEMQQALFVSCPEAARLLLLEPDAFDLLLEPVMVREENIISYVFPAGFNDIRIFCLQLLRTEGLALWQRLAVLGMLCERFRNLNSSTPPEAIQEILDDFIRWFEAGDVVADLADVLPNRHIQMQLFSAPWQSREMQELTPLEQKIHGWVVSGLGDARHTTEAERHSRYLAGLERLELALSSIPHFFQNYLLNEMFRDAFPFGYGVYEHYLRIVVRFGIVRAMLAGVCNAQHALPEPQVLCQTVQSAARRFQHEADLESRICASMKKHGLDALGVVISLLP